MNEQELKQNTDAAIEELEQMKDEKLNRVSGGSEREEKESSELQGSAERKEGICLAGMNLM